MAIVNEPFNEGFKYDLHGYSLFILILVLIVPFILFTGRKQEPYSIPKCGVNQNVFSWSYNENNVMNISKDPVLQEKNWISLSSARDLLHGLNFDNRSQLFNYLKNGITISPGINMENGDLAWILINTDLYGRGNGFYSGCGFLIKDPLWYGFSVFKVECTNNSENKCLLYKGK
jgi:hypothetical protein